MTNRSIYLQHIDNGYTNFLNAENEVAKISRTGLFLCTNGYVNLTLDSEEYWVESNCMFTYFAYSELKINKRSEDLQGIIIGGDLEAIQPMLYKISDFNGLFLIRNNPLIELNPVQMKNMLMYLDLIEDTINRLQGRTDPEVELVRTMKEIRLMQAEMLSNSFMLNVVSCYQQNEPFRKNINRKEDVLLKFVSSLYKNYKEEHEVTYYSAQQYLTSRYFSSIIKEKSGKTPSQWIATALLVEAKNRLRQSTLSIKEISEYLHFPNQSYFGKWFKNLTGISPLEFKNGMDEIKVTEDEFTDMIRRGSTFVSSKIK